MVFPLPVGCSFCKKDAAKNKRQEAKLRYDGHSRASELSIEMNAKLASHDEVTIEFQDVEYHVRSSGRDAILSQIKLKILRGETLVLLGRSGSGKTTLLKLINGLLLATSGNVYVNGRSVTESDPIQLRRGIGYVIQDGGLFPHYSVTENVALVPRLESWEESRVSQRVEEMMRLVGLAPNEFSQRKPRELSGGQRQRVGVARALAADPPILLMDEPFGALDPVTRAELQREFADLSRRLGKTIVFVTHDLREALRLGTRIVLLCKGRIVADAKAEEFLRVEHPEAKAFAASFGVAAEASA
jgi:osmoprotectant transport system ATP-binding protein